LLLLLLARNGGDPDNYKWNVVPLHSTITNEEQSKVFEPPERGRRKIILATNIAESSVTVSDVVYGKMCIRCSNPSDIPFKINNNNFWYYISAVT